MTYLYVFVFRPTKYFDYVHFLQHTLHQNALSVIRLFRVSLDKQRSMFESNNHIDI